jgi:hypothetical protein
MRARHVCRYAVVTLSMSMQIVHAEPVTTGLLCGKLEGEAQSAFISFLNSEGKESQDGVIKVQGPVSRDGVCVRDITVVGAFGVIVVTGESCARSGAEFVASVGKVLGQKGTPESAAATLAGFEIANGSRQSGKLMVYRGEPSPQPQPQVRSAKVSYRCER